MEKHNAIFEMNPGYWYRIPGFNGYEVNSNGVVRSFKNYNKYPYGYILKWYKNKPYTWQLTDNSNDRKVVTIDEIYKAIIDYPYKMQPRLYNYTDISSRNKILEHPKPKDYSLKEYVPTTFKIIDEGEF